MDNADDLGPAEAWQIRLFPRKLRQEIVDQAKAERMTPGEFVTRIMVAARDEGWLLDRHNPIANGQTDPARLRSAVEMIGILHAAGVAIPARTASVARILVGQELRALRRLSAPATSPDSVGEPVGNPVD